MAYKDMIEAFRSLHDTYRCLLAAGFSTDEAMKFIDMMINQANNRTKEDKEGKERKEGNLQWEN